MEYAVIARHALRREPQTTVARHTRNEQYLWADTYGHVLAQTAKSPPRRKSMSPMVAAGHDGGLGASWCRIYLGAMVISMSAMKQSGLIDRDFSTRYDHKLRHLMRSISLKLTTVSVACRRQSPPRAVLAPPRQPCIKKLMSRPGVSRFRSDMGRNCGDHHAAAMSRSHDDQLSGRYFYLVSKC